MTDPATSSCTHEPQNQGSKRNLLFQELIFRFHFQLQGCERRLLSSSGHGNLSQPSLFIMHVLLFFVHCGMFFEDI